MLVDQHEGQVLDSLPCCVLDLQEGHGGEDGGAGVCGGLAHGLQQSVQLSRDGHRRPLHHRDSLRYAHNDKQHDSMLLCSEGA